MDDQPKPYRCGYLVTRFGAGPAYAWRVTKPGTEVMQEFTTRTLARAWVDRQPEVRAFDKATEEAQALAAERKEARRIAQRDARQAARKQEAKARSRGAGLMPRTLTPEEVQRQQREVRWRLSTYPMRMAATSRRDELRRLKTFQDRDQVLLRWLLMEEFW